jgi:hypothetical protein
MRQTVFGWTRTRFPLSFFCFFISANVIETHEHAGEIQRVVKRSYYEIELTANS